MNWVENLTFLKTDIPNIVSPKKAVFDTTESILRVIDENMLNQYFLIPWFNIKAGVAWTLCRSKIGRLKLALRWITKLSEMVKIRETIDAILSPIPDMAEVMQKKDCGSDDSFLYNKYIDIFNPRLETLHYKIGTIIDDDISRLKVQRRWLLERDFLLWNISLKRRAQYKQCVELENRIKSYISLSGRITRPEKNANRFWTKFAKIVQEYENLIESLSVLPEEWIDAIEWIQKLVSWLVGKQYFKNTANDDKLSGWNDFEENPLWYIQEQPVDIGATTGSPSKLGDSIDSNLDTIPSTIRQDQEIDLNTTYEEIPTTSEKVISPAVPVPSQPVKSLSSLDDFFQGSCLEDHLSNLENGPIFIESVQFGKQQITSLEFVSWGRYRMTVRNDSPSFSYSKKFLVLLSELKVNDSNSKILWEWEGREYQYHPRPFTITAIRSKKKQVDIDIPIAPLSSIPSRDGEAAVVSSPTWSSPVKEPERPKGFINSIKSMASRAWWWLKRLRS